MGCSSSREERLKIREENTSVKVWHLLVVMAERQIEVPLLSGIVGNYVCTNMCYVTQLAHYPF